MDMKRDVASILAEGRLEWAYDWALGLPKSLEGAAGTLGDEPLTPLDDSRTASARKEIERKVVLGVPITLWDRPRKEKKEAGVRDDDPPDAVDGGTVAPPDSACARWRLPFKEHRKGVSGAFSHTAHPLCLWCLK